MAGVRPEKVRGEILRGVGCNAQNCRLRSANRGNANNVWNVNTSGNANNNNATNANRGCPDCINLSVYYRLRKR